MLVINLKYLKFNYILYNILKKDCLFLILQIKYW